MRTTLLAAVSIIIGTLPAMAQSQTPSGPIQGAVQGTVQGTQKVGEGAVQGLCQCPSSKPQWNGRSCVPRVQIKPQQGPVIRLPGGGPVFQIPGVKIQ